VSVVVSTQLPLQFVWPGRHPGMQAPPAQTSVAPQAWPQLPQLFLSLCVLTQALPQAVNPASQELPQAPFWQVAVPFAGAVQALPQAPQSAGSDLRSMHALPHLLKPAAHDKPHDPALHVGVAWAAAGHTFPQVPQLPVSVWVTTHEPLQLVVPEGQVVPHVPPAQTWFAPQAWPQDPQLLLSLCSFTQAPPQLE
jgi:hypothetical protein